MPAGNYDTVLFAEHGLYSPALEPKYQIHDRICAMNKGTMTCLSYNTNDREGTKWNQYGGTDITLNANIRVRVTKGGWSGDLTKLGRWTWTRIGGKDGIAAVFVSAYRLCYNPGGLHTLWRQQSRYFKKIEGTRDPDSYALFI